MSTLAKVFTVLLVVLSIAFTVMTVSAVAQWADWRDTALKYEQHARVADTNLRNLIAASAADLATERDNVKAHLARIGVLETQLQSSTGEAARLRTQLAGLQFEKSSADATSRGLLAQLTVADQARAEYQKQRDDLESQNMEFQRRNVDLSDRVNELTARVSVLSEEKRQFEQQNNILRSETEKLSEAAGRASRGILFEEPSGAALAGVEALTPIAATPIRGRVLDVSGSLVTVSVGEAAGVQSGMVFVIHRDSTYVGDIKIDAVDPNQSVGRLVKSAQIPRAGDHITDAFGMAGSRG